MLVNLAVILGTEDEDVGTIFPTEDEVYAILTSTAAASSVDTDQPVKMCIAAAISELHKEYPIGTNVAVVWDGENNQRQWFLARVCHLNNDGTVQCDHYQRVNDNNNTMWRRPKRDDIQDVIPVQIVPVTVETEWVFQDSSICMAAILNFSYKVRAPSGI
ncbi:unnamed protein product [Clavelina lepadiformis]|uniref:Tudor domain-containing protein n=1 Tax=Clavelina lepadiformis TaxID=159417 RepID=A0ABP0FR96_CLALP